MNEAPPKLLIQFLLAVAPNMQKKGVQNSKKKDQLSALRKGIVIKCWSFLHECWSCGASVGPAVTIPERVAPVGGRPVSVEKPYLEAQTVEVISLKEKDKRGNESVFYLNKTTLKFLPAFLHTLYLSVKRICISSTSKMSTEHLNYRKNGY